MYRLSPDAAALAAQHADLAERLAGAWFGRPDVRHHQPRAETAAQDALLRAAAAYTPDRGPFEPFARVAVTNRLRRVYARAKQAAPPPPTVALPPDLPAAPAPETDPLAAELVRRHVARLPLLERAAVRRRYFRGQTFAEIAAGMGVPRTRAFELHEAGIARIRTRITRGRAAGHRPGLAAAAVHWHDGHGLTLREVAAKLRVSVSTAHALYRQGNSATGGADDG